MIALHKLFEAPSIKLNLVDVKKYGFDVDLHFMKQYSNSNKILLNKKVVDALIKAKKDLPHKYNFCITYGYRSLEEQTEIVKQTEQEFKKSHPHNWENLLNKYTGGYEELELKKISPMNHRSGNAVDLKLVVGKKEVDLGNVMMNKKDQIDYYVKKTTLNKKESIIRDNRILFKTILTKHGFKNYKDEWWHWGYVK